MQTVKGRIIFIKVGIGDFALGIRTFADLVSVDDGTLFKCKKIIKTVAYSNIAPCWFCFFNDLVRRCGNREKLFSCGRIG